MTSPPESPRAESPGTQEPAPLRNARAIALLGAAQALALVAGLLRWKIIALLLGPVGVGIVGVIDQLAQVVLQLGSMSLPTVALRFLGKAYHDGTGMFGRLYRGFRLAVLTGGFVVATAALGIFLLFPRVFGAGLEPYGLALALGLLTVPFTGSANLTRSAIATLGRHRDAAVAMAVSAAGLTLAAFVGVRWGGIPGLYIATLIASATVAFLLDWVVRRDAHARSPQRDEGRKVWPLAYLRAQPGVLRFALVLGVVGFTVPLGYMVLRSSVLGALGPAAAGFLAAALTVATGVRTVFTQASSQFLMPRASRDAPKADRAAEVGGYLRTLVVAMFVAALPIALFPGEVVVVLFSARFEAAATFIGVFVLGELILAFGDAYRILLLGFEDLRGFLATTIAAPALVMLGASAVVARFGILGLGLLHVTAALLGLVVAQARLRHTHHTGMTGRVSMLYALLILLGGLAAWVGVTFHQPSLVTWLWKAGLGLALAAVGFAMLPTAERSALLRAVPGLRGRGMPPA